MLYTTVWLLVAIPPLYSGWNFYTAPAADQPYRADYNTFKPAGTVGHGLGIVGSLMIIVGVATYSLRKNLRVFRKWGKLRKWLSFHIFLCTLGPFLVVLHTSFRFSGLVSIAFWSMVIVVSSGVLGRYVYVRIPKTADGQFLNVQQLDERQGRLLGVLRERMGIGESELQLLGFNGGTAYGGPTAALGASLKYDLGWLAWRARWNRMAGERGLDETESKKGRQLVRRVIRTRQQRALLHPFQKLFTYWHVFHIPLAAVMFIILAVHVAVALIFGYTWIY